MSKIINFIEQKRFTVVVIVMVIIWISLLSFFWLKADAVTKDPCSICAKYQGEKVICSTGTYIIQSKTYYPNGSIENSQEQSEQYKKMQKEKYPGLPANFSLKDL